MVTIVTDGNIYKYSYILVFPDPINSLHYTFTSTEMLKNYFGGH
jgi:hypothetical protein